jgi:hypothetical protein
VKIFSKGIITALMLAAVSLMPMKQAQAQTSAEPAIVVGIAKMSEQMDDIGYLAEASGFGQMSFLIKMQVEQFLKGIDDSKASGVLLFFEDGAQEPQALGFIPVSNMEDMLNVLSQNMEIEEGDDFTTIFTPDGGELLMKQVGDYAFVSDREELFEAAPSNPGELLGDLGDNFNVGARVYAQRIPESLRDMAMDMIEEGYNDSLEEMGGDLQGDLQEKNFEMQMAAMKSLINETEELVVGFVADEDTGTLRVDFQITGLDGSRLADQSAMQAKVAATKFAGFLMEGAAFTANACTELSEEDIAQYLDMATQARDEIMKEMEDSDMEEEQFELAQSLAEDFFQVINETVKEGRLDMGAVVTTEEKIEFAAGFQISDANKLEDIVKDLVKAVENEADVKENVTFNLNSGKMNGLRLHEIVIKVPESEEEMLDVIGEEMTIVLGIGDKVVYVAGGSNDPKGLLDKTMNSSSAAAGSGNMIMQYNVFLAPILRMAAGIEGEEMMEEMADKLDETGKDRIRFFVETVDNGMKGTFEIQDAILEMIGVAAQGMSGMMGGTDF